MNAIVAIYRRDGQTLSRTCVENAIRGKKIGGSGDDIGDVVKRAGKTAATTNDCSGFNPQVWIHDNVALAASGTCLRTGESLRVARDGSGSMVVTAYGCLDSVDVLAEALARERDVAECRHWQDVDWLIAAYAKWGTDCVRHLLGDFAFAIWDAKSQSLFCGRDHLGCCSLYVHEREDLVVVGSQPRHILATDLVPRDVSPRRIMDCLVEPLEGADYTSTLYRQIKKLPPASTLAISSRTARRATYWRLGDAIATENRSEQEWIDGIRFHLRQAIVRRTSASGVGSMLSGGLDSSSIAAHLAAINPSADVAVSAFSVPASDNVASRLPWTLLSFAFPDDASSADTSFAKLVAEHVGLRQERIGTNAVEEASIDDLFVSHPTSPFDAFMQLAATVYARAESIGLNTVLDGIDGDLVMGLHGNYIPSLLRSGRFAAFFGEIAANNRNQEGRLSGLIRSIVANTANALPSTLHRWRTSRPDEVAIQRCRASIVREEYAIQHGVVGRFDELRQWGLAGTNGNPRGYHQQQAAWMAHPFATVGMERYQRIAEPFGIWPRHPLFDVELLEYCVNLPWNLRRRNGWSKYGLRCSVEPDLPASACWRQESDNLYPRAAGLFLRRHLVRLEAFVETTLEPILGDIVEVDRLREKMKAFKSGDDDSGMEVWQAFHLSQWLQSV